MLKQIKSTYWIATSIKETATTILHPTLWLRNKARDWAIQKIKNTALKLIGEKTTEWAANHINKLNYTLEF